MIYAPRAIRHFSLASVEARAQRTGRALARPPMPEPTPAAAVRPDPTPLARRVVVRLWLPLTALFLLLAPFALLLAPLIYFAPRPYRSRPLATVLGVGRVLLSLGGTVVHVDTPEALVSIRVF
jgi:hypothetical protein